jgi:hypothetical protein
VRRRARQPKERFEFDVCVRARATCTRFVAMRRSIV